MLKWIGKLIGGSPAAKSSVASAPSSPLQDDTADAAWKVLLGQLLAPVDALPKGNGRPGLASDMLAYVVHGEPLAVLNEVGQRSGLGEALRANGQAYGREPDRWASFYAQFDSVPAAAMLRWAMLLSACTTRPNAQASYFMLPGGVQWPEALLVHACGHNGWNHQQSATRNVPMESFERILVEGGLDPGAMLISAFATPLGTRYGAERRLAMVAELKGFSEAVGRQVEAIRPTLQVSDVAQRLHVLNLLEKVESGPLTALAAELAELGVSSSKQVRAATEPLVRKCGAAMIEPLKSLATKGKPEQRVNALRLLWSLAAAHPDSDLQAFARDTALADKAPSVQALPKEWDSAESSAIQDVGRYDYVVPTIDWSNPLTPAVSKMLESFWHEINDAVEKANKQRREHHERMLAQGKNQYQLHQFARYEASDLEGLREYIASPVSAPKSRRENNRQANWQLVLPHILKAASLEAMIPTVAIKMLVWFDLLRDHNQSLSHAVVSTMNAMHRARNRPSLLELAEMLSPMGVSQSELMQKYCHGWGTGLARDWAADAIWPFFAHNQDALVRLMSPAQNKDYGFDRPAVFRAIASLPTPPAVVVNAMFDLALGTGKSDRLLAQAALANLPGKEERIIHALADGKGEVRTVAAQWLMKLRHAPAVAALESAVSKEKHDVPKGAMLDALKALGQPVEKYLDRKALAVEAKKSLTKGIPKDLEWFPWNALPEVLWGDSGEPVPAEVLRWMLVQAVKQKSAEPNAVLRKYCAMFDKRGREALGQFVLETWIAEDIRPIPAEDAMKQAVSQATSLHNFMGQHPKYYQNSPYLGRSPEEITAMMLPALLRQPAGSASSSKGLLAVAAACAGGRAAPPVARYLKEYYGTRASQGKALIGMLAWIEHPSATQLMLSIGNRFRTKSIQEEATRQADALADRKGWTLAELADRTMPSAGFDETGLLELSYGERMFTARLLPDFKIELFNPDGKKIASLPEPRQDDDADRAKESKKTFAAAKKDIKNIVELQTDRLYEALCTGRDWSFDDWNRYLNQHAIVRRLVQRLVWCLVEDGKVLGTFRPLDDGTLTDADDNEVRPTPAMRVRVAHDSNLEADLVAKWQQHLIDYEVVPLLQQLGKGTYALPPGKQKETEIGDFEGHLTESFKLRGRALKLGYTRGQAQDGGWFYSYEKRFPTLGLTAVLEFTGSPLPEENRTVALLNLAFARSGGDAWNRAKLALVDVPAVLLSECYNDLRLIAAEGTGFDPEWQKKSAY